MKTEEIKKKHESLVTGGYADTLPQSRIKYHTKTTLMAILEELQSICDNVDDSSLCTDERIKDRIRELDNQIEEIG